MTRLERLNSARYAQRDTVRGRGEGQGAKRQQDDGHPPSDKGQIKGWIMEEGWDENNRIKERSIQGRVPQQFVSLGEFSRRSEVQGQRIQFIVDQRKRNTLRMGRERGR